MKSISRPTLFTLFSAVTIVLSFGTAFYAQCGLNFARSKSRISPVNGKIFEKADMNGDGRADIVGLQEDPFDSNNRQAFFILPGDGNGGFGVPIVIPTRPTWRIDDMIVGDYDNDSHKDVMVRFNSPTRDHQIYRNNGDGTFSAAPNASGAFSSTLMEFLLDANADGKGDLVLSFGSGYRIHFGNGDGTFQSPVDLGFGFFTLTGDFNGDSRPDFIAGNSVALNNGNGTFTSFPGALSNGFGENPFAAADLNGDGKTEVITLMLNQPVYVGILKWNGTNAFERTTYTPSTYFETGNSQVFTGKFDANSSTDVIVVSPKSGRTFSLLNDGTGVFTAEVLNQSSAAIFADDFDEDGKSDLMIASNGRSTVGFTGKTFFEINTTFLKNSCTPTGQTRYVDFKGTGFSDFASWDPVDGNWNSRSSVVSNPLRYTEPFGRGDLGDIPAPGDFDGDGKTDKAVFRTSTRDWWINRSSDGSVSVIQFGLPDDRPSVGDYDGDGKSDIAVWRPSDGNWYVWLTGPQQFVVQHWGLDGDKPLPADYDGDGKTDFAVFRPSSGVWYILNSNGGYSIVRFGLAGDHLLPADFDGDGINDIAVYRSADRTFHMLRSSNGAYYAMITGTTTMIPFAGDFNGDSVAEIGGYEVATSSWITSIFGGSYQYGVPNSVPVGSLLVPTP